MTPDAKDGAGCEMPTIGIDLGTTFSAVAYVDDHDMPKVIPNAMGVRTTPSVVYFEDGGGIVVGESARNQALAEPNRTISYIKRHMGDPSFSVNIDGTEWVPEGVSALILKDLKADAEAKLSGEISTAVISVPAYFKDSQRAATRKAGELAGLEVVAIINEPTAAALAYGLGRGEQPQILLIYDLGGGTFDVTALRIEGNDFTILATDGDSCLGGVDVDNLLSDFLAEKFVDHHGVDLREDIVTRLTLREQAEQAKIALTARQSVAVTLSAGQTAMRIDLDRDEFSSIISRLVDATKDFMERAVAGTGLGWPAIDAILPVGGSSRIPAVRKMIESYGKPMPTDVKVDEAVALGAALRARLHDVNEQRREPTSGASSPDPEEAGIVIRDVAVHSLGVRAVSLEGKPLNSIIIPRLTEVPCERERTYATRVDNQKKIEIEVLQGEDADPFSPEVESIGKLAMDDLPGHAMGAVEEHGRPLVDDPARVGPVETLRADETSFRAGKESSHRTSYVTGLVDTKRAFLIDVISGQRRRGPEQWLGAQDEQWRRGVSSVAIDLREGFRRGLVPHLGHATLVADPFHVVGAANHRVDQVRRRVQNECLGHHGRRDDPLTGFGASCSAPTSG